MINIYSKVTLLAFSILIVACSSPPKIINVLQPGALDSDATVGIVWLSRCSGVAGCKKSGAAATLGEFRPVGTVGLLTLGAVLSAHQEIIDVLDSVDAAEIINPLYLDISEQAFQKKGINARVVRDPYYPGSLKKQKRHKTIGTDTILVTNKEREAVNRTPFVFEQTYDLTNIASTENFDYLLVLDLLEYGVQREFGPFAVPTTAPYGVGAVRLYLVDVRGDLLLLNDYSYHERHVIDGEWKQSGSWSNLLETTNESLRRSIEDVMTRFIDATDSL